MIGHDTPQAQRALELLPWYVNGTLDETEREAVEAHLATCAACRDELQWLSDVEGEVGRDSPVTGESAALARVHERLDQLETSLHPAAVAWRIRSGWREARPWLRAAVLAQAVLVAGLLIEMVPRGDAETYRTLSAPDGAGAPVALLWVAFEGTATEAALRATLTSVGGRIVDGPIGTGIYTVAVPSGRVDHALETLRGTLLVRTVERAPGQGR